MKRITVKANEVALVTKLGRLQRILTEGQYWLLNSYRYEVYQLNCPITLSSQWDHLVGDPKFASQVDLVEVSDQELWIEFKNNLFTRLLRPGKYLYWKSGPKFDLTRMDLSTVEVDSSIPTYILNKSDIQQYQNVYVIENYEKGLLYIDGEFIKTLGPGIYRYWKSDKIATVSKVDMRVQLIEVLGQEILTKDKAGLRVNFSAQYKINDVEKAMVQTKDYLKQLYNGLQLVLREYLSSLTLDQMLANKLVIGSYVLENIADKAELLGVKLLSGGIKDIILPGDIKEIMNQVLIAQKKAQANTIMRQEETASTRSLLNTAKLMEQNSMLLKLKEMEYMEKISEKVGEISLNGGGRVIDQLRKLVISDE